MTSNRSLLYRHYVSAWSALSDADRMQVLSETLSKAVAYRDAMTQRSGLEGVAQHLSAFQERRPGCSFRLISMLSWGSDALANWQFVDSAGEPGLTGYDALTYNDNGLIPSIVGFSDTQKQQIKTLL